MTGKRIVLRGGMIADGTGAEQRSADIAIRDGRIVEIGTVEPVPGDDDVDVSGRTVMPGFIDAHSHAEGVVFDPAVQEGLLRQGVTTVIGGQDGVSYAPGDGAYGADYFGALNGVHPTYRGDTVAELLATYDATTPINVGYLIPLGTVRHEVMGYIDGPADARQTERMRELVVAGMADGALGVSTGLDYVPGIHQSTAELIDVIEPAAAAGGLYVTHMRGGYEENAKLGLDEVAAIARATGAAVHVSHLHGPSEILLPALDELTSAGVDVSFDAYPYRRGCTLAAMPLLPPELVSGARADVVAALADPGTRQQLLSVWFPSLDERGILGPEWPDNFAFAHIGASEWSWAEGLTVREGASRANRTPAELVLDLLVAADLQVTCVVAVRQARTYDDMARIVTDDRHTVGSDGIWIGGRPHPRARGTFARFLSHFHRDRGDYTAGQAARHLAGLAADRFGLSGRGVLAVGNVADIAVVDLAAVAAGATYENPQRPAVGIDDVLVDGVFVLRDGALTGATPGQGLRRS